jgi:short-subunit dehydrogenase
MAVFLVTGASQGIGAALARAFAAEPEAQLALVSRSIDKLDEVANRCRGAGAEATVLPCDVTNAQEVAHMAVAVQDQLGLPDVVVNNAGLFRPGSLFETNIDSFRAQIDVNLISAFLVTKAFLDDMTTRGSGQVVYMASGATLRA